MEHINRFNHFQERILESKKGNTNLVKNLTIAMLLINPNFLDNILDKGIKGRYTMDTSVYLNDLRNLLLKKNRFKLGIFNHKENKYTVDNDISKANNMFNEYSPYFNIEKDWNMLKNARKTALNILEHLDIESDEIENILWLAPNKDSEHTEDLIITHMNKQYPIYTNKKVDKNKTQSFNTFSEILIGEEQVNKIYTDEYKSHWDKLTQEWVSLVYENVNKTMQKHISKFVHPNRINTITYENYSDIKHYNKEFQHLGEYIEELDKNILYLSDLLAEIYKHEELFNDFEIFKQKWEERKTFILKSKIIEHIYSKGLKQKVDYKIKKTDKYTIAENKVKMKLVKLLSEIIDLKEKETYYFSKSGEEFNKLPSRQFFRDMYEDIDVKYDFHVNLTDINIEDEDDIYDFTIRYDLKDEPIFKINIKYKWTKGEMNGNLSTKMSIEINNKFNEVIDEVVSKEDYILENWDIVSQTQYNFLSKTDLNSIDENLKCEIYNNIIAIQKID